MNMADAIKKCALDAFEASVPCDVVYAKVLSDNPLKISAGDLVLEGEILSVCKHLEYKECSFLFGGNEKVIVVNEGLKTGDCVVLVRKRSGEGYVVVGKL